MSQPSKDQLLTALEKAHLAGDTQAAKEFASWHNELYPEPAPAEAPGIIDRVKSAFQGEPEIDGYTGAAKSVPEGPQMVPYEPTLWDKVKALVPANKDAAWVEYQARQIAKEEGISVDEVYKSAGGSRPVFNPEGRPTIQALAEATNITVKELPDLIPGAANTVMRSIRGGDESADKTWLDRAVDYTEPEPPENPDPNYDSFYGIGKSLGYSLSTMTAAATAGALTGLATKNPLATGMAAGTTAGAVAYRGSRDEFLGRIQDGLNQKAMEVYGRELTQEEWDKAYEEFDAAATKYGAWEAIPEAVGNLVFLRAFTAPLKGIGKQQLKEVTKRAATVWGTENTTETATALGQNSADRDAGLTNEQLTVGDAFKKQVVPTTIVTGLMGGAGAATKAGIEASKTKERRLGEVLNQIVDESQVVGPDAAQAFDPANAQQQQTAERKTMAELVAEKLQARGVVQPSVSQEPQDLIPDTGKMVESTDVSQETQEVVTNEEASQEVTAEEKPAEQAQAYGQDQERVEHTTKRGRLLTGVIDKEMTLDEAKNIDPYAFRKDGGVFIRDNRIEEFNKAQEARNATVDTGSTERSSDKPARGREPEQGRTEPAGQRVDNRSGEPDTGRTEDLPVADAAPRNDQAVAGNPIGRNIEGSTIYQEPDGKRYRLRGGDRVYEPIGIEMGSSPSTQERDEFFLTEDEIAATNSKDVRALQKRIDNINQESNPESIKLKSESVTRAINNSNLKAPKDFFMKVDGGSYGKRKDAGEKILAIANKMADRGTETQSIGEYAGFELRLDNISGAEFVVTVQGQQEYQADIPDITEADAADLATRIVNVVKRISSEAKSQAEVIAEAKRDTPELESQISEWGKAEELAKKKSRHALVIAELKPKNKGQDPEQDQESAMMSSMGVDVPMPNWTPTYRQAGVPGRPDSDKFYLSGRSVQLKSEDKPTRREGIRVMVEDVIGPRIYQGKVRGKFKLGFYKRNNSEVRITNYDDVEVMAHEMAHYLDMHYRFNERFTRAYKDRKFKNEVESLSYTSDKKLRGKEGFAEFVRLWLTNYDAAKTGAPLFTAEFEKVLRTDDVLNRKMGKLQEEMHRWYLQGPRAQFRAKSGKELTQSEQITQYMQSYPMERYRQEVIDKIHAAKVIERTLKGGVGDASISPYKQFQLVNGAESLHESILKDGTPSLSEDGSAYEVSGKGLNEIFEPVAKHGWKRFDLLMDYFKARRANELMKQGRERLFTKEEIQTGLKLGVTYPEFREVFKEYQEFNQRMLDFYVDMGLLDSKQRTTFAEANRNYVPFHRVIERLEDGQDGGTASAIGKRLTGGSQNVRDIAENIVEGLYANVRAALIARAKQTLYRDIMQSQDGAIFAAKLSPDSKLVRVHNSQMASKVAETMANVGLTVSKGGMVMAGDVDNQITDVDDIAQALESNPDLLNFWTFGHKPNTAETYVDSAIIDGKRVWFEVRSPLLVDMLTGMRGFRSGALLNAMFRVKNLQTRTVTSMLQFLGPNAVRDTLSAFVISKNKFIPVWSTLRGMGDVVFNTEVYKEFRRQGGGYGTRIEARTEETRKRRQLDLPSRNMWDTASKMLAGYDRFASAFEYGSRLGDYRAARVAGKNPLEAAWEAREVATDFSKMGRNELWAKFLRTVPFMNAGIQGLDKTAREIFEMKGEMKGANLAKVDDAKLRFLSAGGSITAMTVILWLLNNDDDRYKALTADQKARFWWIFIPGAEKPLKIPRPYDIGHLFGTIPETSLDYIKDRDGDAAAKQMAWTLANTLGIGDYPGVFQPIIEVKTNKKFTGAPVVPYGLMNVPAEYQFTDRTPQIYRSVGEALGVSPLVAEHYTKGYLRYVEAYISDASEAMLWDKERWGERPFSDKGPIDYLTYQFQGQRVPYRTKWTEGYFELKKKAAGIKSAFDVLTAQAIRDDSMVLDFSKDRVNQLLINMDSAFGKIDSAFSDQNAALASIKYDKELPRKEKERKIEDWYEKKNKVLAQFYEQANKALRQAEKEVTGD